MSVRLERPLAERLKILAFRKKMSMNEIATGLIRAYVEKEEHERV